jgi:hypothetical protein
VGIEETRTGEIAFRTRGDSNHSDDGFFVTKTNLIGKVIYHTDEGSFITNAYAVLTSGIGFFTLIVIPVIVITVIILHENIKKITNEMKAIRAELDREAKKETKASSDSENDNQPSCEGEKSD